MIIDEERKRRFGREFSTLFSTLEVAFEVSISVCAFDWHVFPCLLAGRASFTISVLVFFLGRRSPKGSFNINVVSPVLQRGLKRATPHETWRTERVVHYTNSPDDLW